MKSQTRLLTLSAMFTALGVLFPMLFHAIGLGAVFLPMFWPIAAAAFFLPLRETAIVALAAPVLSWLLTGMPPASPPILQVMVFELETLACTTALLYRKQFGQWISLAAGLFLSRLTLFLFILILAPLFGLPQKVFSIGWTLRGVPGLAAMLLIIPPLAAKVKREKLRVMKKHVETSSPLL
ncbi:MAG: ECF transporter S component [candidate division KSB1 bacterium]|nr:ECF transporter S component [candidate division KSB1 bacterium]